MGVKAANEKQFMAAVLQMARLLGWRVYHTHYSRRSAYGYPDLTCVKPGRMFVAELKVGRGKLKPEQAEWLDAFRAAGVPAYEWRPENWEKIEAVLRGESG